MARVVRLEMAIQKASGQTLDEIIEAPGGAATAPAAQQQQQQPNPS